MASLKSTDTVIVSFQETHAPSFKELNLHWLTEYGLLEPEDLKYLDRPQQMILDHGGQVFFALRDGVVVGTCGIVPVTATDWELMKLAVHPSEQSRGLGRRLSLVALQYAREHGARKAVLTSNCKLTAAIRLYESMGFQHAPMPAAIAYATANVYMELSL